MASWPRRQCCSLARRPGRRRRPTARRCSSSNPGSPGGRQGPPLHGVVGRKAGSVEGFNYSAGLKDADFVWDEAKFDAYLTNPQAVIKGGVMPYRQSKQDIRQRVIQYLKEQS